jgi:hypothetical protein
LPVETAMENQCVHRKLLKIAIFAAGSGSLPVFLSAPIERRLDIIFRLHFFQVTLFSPDIGISKLRFNPMNQSPDLWAES